MSLLDAPVLRSDGFNRYDAAYRNFTTACDFYCDSRRGNDANDGRSSATAVRTIARLQVLIGASNNIKIGLARGSSWRELLSISGAGVGVYSYGLTSDSRPVLRGDDPISPGSWSLTAGKTLTYQATISLPGATSNKQWINVWENGSQLAFVADAATVESTPGSYTVTNQTNASGAVTGTGTTTLFIHATDGSNPGSSGKLYEYTRRTYGLTSRGNAATVVGIETKRNGAHDGSLVLYGIGNTVWDCIAREGGKHNGFVGGGDWLYSQAVDQYYGTTSADLLVFYGDTSTGTNGQNWTAQYSTFSRSAYNAVANVNAVYSHTDGIATWNAGLIKGCTFNNVANGFDGTVGAPVSITVDGCTGNVNANLLKYAPLTSASVLNNGVTLIGVNSTLVSAPSATSAVYSIKGNRVNALDPFAFINISPPSGAPRVTIDDNVFFISGVTRTGVNAGVIQSAGTLSLTNTAFDAPVTIFAKALQLTLSAFTAANNTYCAQSNANAVTVNGVTIPAGSGPTWVANAQAFQAGLEANSNGSGVKGTYIGQVM